MRKNALGIVFVGLALAVAPLAAAGSIEDDLWSLMADVNSELAFQGADYRLEVIEYLTGGDEAGNEVFFSNVGSKRLAYQFVPGDPRRTDWSGPVGPGDDITWASDMVQGSAPGVGYAATQGAIANAMATWDGVNCSTIPLTAKAVGGNLGFLELLFFGTGSPPVADITHAGFGSLVDLLLPPPIIAATFTFRFVDDDGNDTDIDNDGYADAALREIYYTNNFVWGDGTNGIDVETIVLHETGHGLSQAHFGKLFRTDKNGKFHFAPFAVMNAGYTGGQSRELLGTDNGGHCSMWASWPNN